METAAERRLRTVAVGSAPVASTFESITLSVPTRITPGRSPSDEPAMIAEWRALSEGTGFACHSEQPALVAKAQLPGPVTLHFGGYSSLRDTARTLARAIESLLEVHPDLTELWLDEPLLDSNQADRVHLLDKCLAALRAEFFGIRFGVHTCANAPWERLLNIPALDCVHFDATRFSEPFLAALGGDPPPADVVWGVVPTLGGEIDLESSTVAAAQNAVAMADAAGCTGDIRVSTACGLGALDEHRARSIAKVLGRLTDYVVS